MIIINISDVEHLHYFIIVEEIMHNFTYMRNCVEMQKLIDSLLMCGNFDVNLLVILVTLTLLINAYIL